MSIDQQFIEFVIKSLVTKPEAVVVARTIDEKGVLLELTVDPEDLGRVIGKRGATAQSVRTLLRALGTKNDARYNLKIIDNGLPGARTQPSEPRDDNTPAAESKPKKAANDDSWASDEKVEKAEEAPKESDALARTRAELSDLDDLDI